MTTHSRLGASSAKRWMECPGSFALCDSDDVQRPGTSVYAAAGTVAHELAEWCLAAPGRAPEDQDGAFHQCQGHEIVVTAEMIDAVDVYLRAIGQHRRRGCLVAHEQRVGLGAWWRGIDEPGVKLFGTCDTWIYEPARQHLTVIDFKYGAGVYVTVRDNPQLLYYAAGALLEVPGQVRDVTIIVVQPRARGQEPVRADTFSVLDLRIWIDFVLKPAVAAVFDPAAPFATGTHCRFCPARPTCPAYADRAQAAARDEFSEVTDTI